VRRLAGAPGGIAALACCLWVALAWRFRFTTDDAYISFRYARHLAQGHGLRFNLLEGAHPTEGYSNLLWTLWLAVPEALGLGARLPALALSAACAGALLLLFLRQLSRRGHATTAGTVAGALCLAAAPNVAVWSTSGMETAAFALAVFALSGAVARGAAGRAWGIAALAAAVVWLRADGLAFALAVAVPYRGQRAARVALAAALAAIALQTLWRLGYHGDWLPNTSRAKLHLGQLGGLDRLRFIARGLAYVASNALSAPAWILAAILGLLAARDKLTASSARPELVTVLLMLCWSALTGGDFMAFGRFLVPALPFLALAAARGVDALQRTGRRGAAGLAACLLPALGLAACLDMPFAPRAVRSALSFRWGGSPASEVERWADQARRAPHLAELGRALALNTRPGESIALLAIGAVSYHCQLEVFDLAGLVDREVAAVPPTSLGVPGHDLRELEQIMAHRTLTYLGARLLREEELAALGPDVLGHQGTQLIRLDPARGFAPGSVLVLVRAIPGRT
jgi:hypothetical protein